MNIINTFIEGLKIIELNKITDNRGYFLNLFEKDSYFKNLIDIEVSQINCSFNYKKGTLRGLHFQKELFSEAKIISCLKGKIFDVAVDLRKNSLTYGQWFGIELSENKNKILYIPKGFAHGFQTLVNNTEVMYFMSGKYSRKSESGLVWNDPLLKIKWPLKPTVISEKDKKLSKFKKAK
jgi:dTDP-4-dehydrorhamnose 3,5-epimerase